MGDLSLIPELYATDFVAHFPAGWEIRGRSGVREVIESARSAFSDWTETVEDIIIEGDKAVSRYVSTGVHNGYIRG
jgi:predicted ester cyclase